MANFNEILAKVQKEREARNVLVYEHPENKKIIGLHYSDRCVFNENWNEDNLMLRDVVLDLENEKVLALPIKKFHNHKFWARHELTFPEGTAEITKKEDGVRVTSFYLNDKVNFLSEGSFVGHVIGIANDIWRSHFSNVVIPKNLTCTFEVMHPLLRVIAPQSETRFVLVAAVDMETGEDYNHEKLDSLQQELNKNAEGMQIGLIEKVEITVSEAVKSAETLPWYEEGFVVRIGDTRIKVKSDAYVRVFKTMFLMSERQKMEVWADGKFDELVLRTPVDFHAGLLNRKNEFESLKKNLESEIQSQFKKAPKSDRKSFALWVKDNAANNLKLLFDLLDGKLTEKTIRQHVYLEFKKNK